MRPLLAHAAARRAQACPRLGSLAGVDHEAEGLAAAPRAASALAHLARSRGIDRALETLEVPAAAKSGVTNIDNRTTVTPVASLNVTTVLTPHLAALSRPAEARVARVASRLPGAPRTISSRLLVMSRTDPHSASWRGHVPARGQRRATPAAARDTSQFQLRRPSWNIVNHQCITGMHPTARTRRLHAAQDERSR